jgi:hypothetical protein
MKTAEKILVPDYSLFVECPHCGYENSGFTDDPRGSVVECFGIDCGEKFNIPKDAPIEIYS